jgi:uncharacterized membrane protein
MSEVHLHIIVAAFAGEMDAEDALHDLKEAGKENEAGIEAAVAMRKDGEGNLHFKDVGMTPGKGALAGVVLGAVIGVLTGGTGLAMGAIGALAGGLVGRRKQAGTIPTDRINQVAASLAPGSSAIVAVVEPKSVARVEVDLDEMGADLLTAPIPTEIARQLEANRDEAYSLLQLNVALAMDGPVDAEKED